MIADHSDIIAAMRSILCAATLATVTCLSLAAQGGVAGEWMITLHNPFGPDVGRLVLAVNGDALTGSLRGRAIEGTVKGNAIEFTFQDSKVKGALEGSELKGDVVFPDRVIKWTAIRVQPRPATPRTHDFEPQEFHQYFSSSIKPVLRIHPGDTVRTWAVDAGGRDKAGKPRSGGGNPQTGPFYVEGALPNDTLVVRLTKVRTNRDWAGSGNTIMRNALEPGSLGNIKWAPGFPEPLEAGCGEEHRLSRKADRGLEGIHRPASTDAWLRRDGAARHFVDSYHRLRALRRQHGLQPDP